MKTKRLLTLLLFLCVCSVSIAQEIYTFYVEIPDIKNIPKVTHSKKGNRIAYPDMDNTALNTVFNTCEVYSCKKVFKTTKKQSLQNIYLVECNSMDLINELIINFKNFYPRIEEVKSTTFAIPDDYGERGGFISEQSELDYIRAPEAWNITTGSKDIIVGVSDTHFHPDHEDLRGTLSIKVNAERNNLNDLSHHGSRVSSFVGANTNNGKGLSSIGYNSYIYAGVGTRSSVMNELSLLNGVKVLNASWGSASSRAPTITPTVYDEIINERGIVVVASAGNGNRSGEGDPEKYFVPASYKDVISVSTIGHTNKTWGFFGLSEVFEDHHEFRTDGEIRTHQHNDSIDIVAPGYALLSISPQNGLKTYSVNGQTGTSYSGPMVAGTVALMFDVNYCLSPKEVETILKLTAVKIDNLPQNLPYYGKLGAGKLDAYEAVKMAKDMHDPFGTVEVKNRILYRPWFYKLVTAPYEIKMTNNTVTEGAKLKFRARNTIELTSGYYAPGPGGYIDLAIDTSIKADCAPPPTNTTSAKNSSSAKSSTSLSSSSASGLTLFPNPTSGRFSLSHNESIGKIVISDITGKRIYYEDGLNDKNISVDISKVKSGIYFIEITETLGAVKGLKIIKE